MDSSNKEVSTWVIGHLDDHPIRIMCSILLACIVAFGVGALS